MTDNNSDEFFPIKRPPDADDLIEIRNTRTNSPFGSRTDGPWYIKVGDIPGGGVEITAGTGLDATPTNPIVDVGTIFLTDTTVTPGTYGSNTTVGQFTVDQQGRLTFAANVEIAGGGGSVSVTPGISVNGPAGPQTNIVIDPSPGTTTFTVGLFIDLTEVNSVTAQVNSNLTLYTLTPTTDEDTHDIITQPSNGSVGINARRGGSTRLNGGIGHSATGVDLDNAGGDGGVIVGFAGNGGASTNAGDGGVGGNITFVAGNGGAAPGSGNGGQGGHSTIYAGSGGSTEGIGDGGFGGDLTLRGGFGGAANGTGDGGQGGDTVIFLTLAGPGGTPGRNGQLILTNLPTADPTVSGAVWSDTGTLKISP